MTDGVPRGFVPGCGCGAWLVRQFAAMGTEATVTSVPPIYPTGYVQLGMACPHGVLWYTEPTREQILAWQRDGVL